MLLRQVELMMKYKDPHNAILESRKHAAWYMTGLKGAAALRRMCGEIASLEDISRICEKALEEKKAENMERMKKATAYYNEDAKPGSLASKANMVRKFEEKNTKK